VADRLHTGLVEAFDAFLGALPGGRHDAYDGYDVMSYPPLPLPSFNGVWSARDGEDVAAALAPALARFAAPGVMMRDAQPLVRAEARRLGLTESVEIPGMLVERDDFRPVDLPDVTIDAVSFDDARTLLADAFDIPAEWFAELYTSAALDRVGATAYVLRANGRAVSTALGFAGADGLGIFNVATPTLERGLGYGAAVTSYAIADGLAAGARFAFLQSSDLGESVYRRLGFEQVATYTLAFAPAG
jgi:hypothetical protein